MPLSERAVIRMAWVISLVWASGRTTSATPARTSPSTPTLPPPTTRTAWFQLGQEDRVRHGHRREEGPGRRRGRESCIWCVLRQLARLHLCLEIVGDMLLQQARRYGLDDNQPTR
jgi:hypothetical protein